ncbi:MAG: beta-propeller domain-containing protein [Chloroflexota bacterium]|nr:beta-propeller domain-containing protein [Chloroflexota bacterium]MDE2896260.1 beta-propeller domain-containing protein [Chloroflexota bacterium]
MIRSRLWLIVLVALLGVAVVATQHLALAQSTEAPALRRFNTCAELHDHYVRLAVASAEEERYEEEAVAEEEEAAFEEDAMADDSGVGGDAELPNTGTGPVDEGEVSDTGTNIQERGVDESDIIKTDGAHFYILRPQSLLIAEISADGPLVEVGRIDFSARGYRQELLIGSGKAIVVRQLAAISTSLEVDDDELIKPAHDIWYERQQAELLEIDIADPSSPALVHELDLDGRFLSARLVGSDLRVAMQHSSAIPYVSPWSFGWQNRWTNAERYNRALQGSFQLGRWFPLYGLQNHVDNSFSHGYAVECSQTFAPEDRLPTRWGELPSTAFMLSFNIGEDAAGIGDWGSVGVLGMATDPTVYASRDSLYLAAPHNWWRDTAIHRFDISDPLESTYFGGATVTGQLLSQWSLSEHDGYLRVATTNRNRWPWVSSVTVLEAVSDESVDDDNGRPTGSLREVGRVGGLGKTEEIKSVRFAGDVGYVVTFRLVDPLYVLDLSDPANPMEVGELKIPGFSRYLHPLSGGLLLGVGRDADPQTGWEWGLQATLFDVSDPANPTQIAILPLGHDAYSPVEHDHRAFRYQNGVAWIPVGPIDHWLRQNHDGAFFGVRVTSEGLSHESTLRVHGEARRAIPLGERIHLLGGEEIRTYDLGNYADLGALSFAPEWDNRWLPVSPE